jgi:hypothetical protein
MRFGALLRYLVNDTIIIRYCIELVVSTGGALSRNGQVVAPKQAVISVPPSNMGRVRNDARRPQRSSSDTKP